MAIDNDDLLNVVSFLEDDMTPPSRYNHSENHLLSKFVLNFARDWPDSHFTAQAVYQSVKQRAWFLPVTTSDVDEYLDHLVTQHVLTSRCLV